MAKIVANEFVTIVIVAIMLIKISNRCYVLRTILDFASRQNGGSGQIELWRLMGQLLAKMQHIFLKFLNVM